MQRYSDSIERRLTGRHKKCIKFCGNNLKNKKILNIGCYNGWFEKAIVEKGCNQIIGVDINDKFLELSKKNVSNARFLRTSVFSLPFPDSYFDLVTMFDVLEHIPKNKEKVALAEIKRVLGKTGKLIVSTPKSNLLSNLLDPAWYFGHRHYSPSNITSLLKDAGLDIERIDSGGGFYELISIILLYFFKWILQREIPFKHWFDEKRKKEYLEKSGFVTLFVEVVK